VKLSTKLSLTVTGVLGVAFLTGGVGLVAVRGIESLMRQVTTDNMPSVRAAEELEIALLEQRGFVSSFMLDNGNRAWLDELERRKPAFEIWAARARATAHAPEEHRILDQLIAVYERYDSTRDRVLALYHGGDTGQARALLLGDLNRLYDEAYLLCENLIAANERYIERSLAKAQDEVNHVALLASASAVITAALGAVLLSVFFRGFLVPLRRMADDARNFAGDGGPSRPSSTSDDELRALGFYMRSLMSDVAETQSHLERSREQLLTSEKLASLGKLAASVAHEIRNPLTSLKMRLYTVRSAEKGGEEFDEDLRVISEEVVHLEEIVRNFLEFSRPPEPRVLPRELPKLFDKVLELSHHWFVEKNVNVRRDLPATLPPVLADAEQMKQVFLNLLRNAVEAVPEGGSIEIAASEECDRSGRPMVVVRVHDNGPGVPAEIRSRIPEPFLSTKEGGTGLGLCIAGRILAQHGGHLEIEDAGESGATFAVWIPAARA